MFLRNSANKNFRIIWYDIETTGFNIFKNSIIEIAAVDNLGNEFQTLISYDKPLPKKIVEITKITNDMLKDKPDITSALHSFVNFIKLPEEAHKSVYMIGHNSNSFDLPFIKAQCAKYEVKFPKIYSIDSMRLSQYVLDDQYSHSLAALCELFGIVNTNAHRAMSDVYTTQNIFNNLCLLFKKKTKKCSMNLIYYTTSF